jgi:hypothetical protein
MLRGAGCAHDVVRFYGGTGVGPPAVPELDAYVIDLESIQPTSSQEQVTAILGESPFVSEHRAEGKLQDSTWLYPIRAIGTVPLPEGAKAQRQVVPAAALQIRLDASARVTHWGFVHPMTGAPLPIRETIEHADAWREAVCNAPKRIELAVVLRPGTSKADVLAGMRWFESLSAELETSQVRIVGRDRCVLRCPRRN